MSNLPAGSEKPKSRRRWLQFSLSTLFVLTLGVAGFLSGYRVGEERGYQTWLQKRLSETPVTRVYDVADLVSVADPRKHPASRPSEGTLADFDSLIDLITTTIQPEEWDSVGGPGSVAPHEGTLTLVVHQYPFVHEELENLFQTLREKKAAGTSVP